LGKLIFSVNQVKLKLMNYKINLVTLKVAKKSNLIKNCVKIKLT